MRNLLVPTDFSPCADEALATAALFARQYDATIHLLHVSLPNKKRAGQKVMEEELKAAQYEAEESINQSIKLLIDKYSDVKIISKVVEGALVKVIDQYSQEEPIDLLVMGSHGAGGKQEFFIGSNTQKVVRQVHINALVVKNKMDDLKLNHVVFASNFDERDKASLLQFKKFVAPFTPKVHLVHINTDPFFGLPYTIIKDVMKEAETLFAPLEVESHYLRDLSVDQGVRHIAENIQADLIGISNHIKHPLKRIFSGSNVEALVNHSKVPVLSIDYA